MSDRDSFVSLRGAAAAVLMELSREAGSWREKSPLALCRGTRDCRQFRNEAALILPAAQLGVLQTFKCCLQRRSLQKPAFMLGFNPIAFS